MNLIQSVDNFFKPYGSAKWLLALSGGSDSMALFHCLLALDKRAFVIAHVDHGWRKESQEEAKVLQKMAEQHQITFHLKTLDPSTLKGNLEASCRTARYAFFKEICLRYNLEGVMTAHHQSDQAETILKRVFEGTHWTNLPGLQAEGMVEGLKVIRPLLEIPKKVITDFLNEKQIHYFHDKTNDDVKFLRAKMRHQMLPELNHRFGKDVQPSLIHLGNEMREVRDYIEEMLEPYLLRCQRSPAGIHLDLTDGMPHPLIVKMVIRHLAKEIGFIPSRQILAQAAKALLAGDAHKNFMMGTRVIKIDRQQLFISSHR